MDTMVEAARQLARTAHEGQVDKLGAPYFGHVERVAANFSAEPVVQTVAYLHDVVEDTSYTLCDLEYPQEVLDAVEAITRQVDETYKEFIDRVSRNEIATRVKIADLKDNLDPERMTRAFSDETIRRSMTRRYLRALETLSG